MSSSTVAAPAIRAIDVRKRYRLGEVEPYRALRDSIGRVISAPARAAVSLVRGRQRTRTTPARDGYVWALDGVSFEIAHGEVVGLIGPNGAGKSTLLKILALVTDPTSGRAEMRGRVGSLLEVGTGFHPELTGRENAYLSGAILGMPRAEIRRKFEDIVAFAEVERFIDTPVKRYSSGMYTRLAFAVAAHLEPEILLVDEVLAVGDAAFQKRCLGKMDDVAREGRTVVFVSHNMTAINQLCPRSLLLVGGRVVRDGPTPEVIRTYLESAAADSGERIWAEDEAPGGGAIRLRAVRVRAASGVTGDVPIDEPVAVEVDFEMLSSGYPTLCVNLYLLDASGTVVLSTVATPGANALPERWFGEPHPPGFYRARCELPADFLNDGRYYISVFLVTLGPVKIEAEAREAISFNVFDTGSMRDPGQTQWDGLIRVRLPWTTERLDTP